MGKAGSRFGRFGGEENIFFMPLSETRDAYPLV
jgi:hypothetical protein